MSIEIKPSQALDLWRIAIVESVRRDSPDLSARQMALLLNVYLTPAPHTVRGLSDALNISKPAIRSEEHTSELQSHHDLVCRLLLEKKKKSP